MLCVFLCLVNVKAKTQPTECAECRLHLVVFCIACFHTEAVDVWPCVTLALPPTPKQMHTGAMCIQSPCNSGGRVW